MIKHVNATQQEGASVISAALAAVGAQDVVTETAFRWLVELDAVSAGVFARRLLSAASAFLGRGFTQTTDKYEVAHNAGFLLNGACAGG